MLIDDNISVSGLKDIYKFAQFHLHWGYTSEVGSEHTIDGKVIHWKAINYLINVS